MHGTLEPLLPEKIRNAEGSLVKEGYIYDPHRIFPRILSNKYKEDEMQSPTFMEFKTVTEDAQIQMLCFLHVKPANGNLDIADAKQWRVIGLRLTIDEYAHLQKENMAREVHTVRTKNIPSISLDELLDRDAKSATALMREHEYVLERRKNAKPGGMGEQALGL